MYKHICICMQKFLSFERLYIISEVWNVLYNYHFVFYTPLKLSYFQLS